MKLLYLTAIKYPSTTATAHQIKSMGRAFKEALGDNFLLIVDRAKEQNLKSLNFYEMNCPFSRFRTLYYFYRFFIGKIPFLGKETIIYTKDPQLIFIANLFKKKHNYKTCFELHMPWKSKVKKIVWRTDFFIVLNEHLKSFLIKNFNLTPEKIFVFPDAVDLKKFDIKKSKEECRDILGLPQRRKIAGYVGRFKTGGKEKGIRNILEAVPLIKKEVLHCFAGGKPKEIKEYQKIATRIGILEKCIFVPFQPFEKVPIYMCAMDLFLMPFPREEHYEYFMSPLKLFEYMASKRPLIASDLPSLRNVLNEKNSLLVESDNNKKLAEAIKKILGNEELGKKLAKRAYTDVIEYTWEKRAKKIIGFLKNNLTK